MFKQGIKSSIRAKFIGRNGSMGHKKNTVYNLEVKIVAPLFFETPHLIVKNLNLRVEIPYKTIHGFLANWEYVGLDNY